MSPQSSARVKVLDYDFAELMIKGKGSNGNIVTKYPVKKVVQKSLGESTLGGREIYYDEVIGRLNTEGRGRYLGSFNTDDTILVVYEDGSYELTSFDLANHYTVEKIKVLNENLAEIQQMAQDALEDAILMGCDERQVREVLQSLVDALENPYRKTP